MRIIILLVCYIGLSLGINPNGVFGNDEKDTISLPERGICAHRGAMVTHPENTIPAFQEAIRLGVHMIEFDVRMSKDGHLVIVHDSTVDRTTTGTGEVTQLTLDELKQLDAGIKQGEEFAGTKIPTLKETLHIMPTNIWLNVHLKGDEKLGAEVTQVLVDENRLHQSFLACTDNIAKAARRVFPDIKICSMDRQPEDLDYVKIAINTKAQFIQLRGDGVVNPDIISLLKQNHFKINYYGTDSPTVLATLFKSGIDFPLANHPAPMLNVAQEKFGIKPVQPVFRD